MAQAEVIEAPTDASVTSILLPLNEALLERTGSPWFRALGRSAVASGTIWEIPASDGAAIYAIRDWNEYAAPVSIDGADELELSLRRPGEVTKNPRTDGVGYHLWLKGAESQMRHDGYAAEQCENEILTWTGTDSPAALVRYIASAIHHGRIGSAMNRTVAEYATVSPQGRRSVRMLASQETTVTSGQSAAKRNLTLTVGNPSQKRYSPPQLSLSGTIAQAEPPAWEIAKLEASGSIVGVGSYRDARGCLTPEHWAKVWRIGASTLNRCTTDMTDTYKRALAEHKETTDPDGSNAMPQRLSIVRPLT